MKPAMDWRTEKENAGRFTWTLGLYGTAAMAAEAGLTEEEYWQQIIDACFLTRRTRSRRWREVSGQLDDYVDRLNALHDRPPARRRRGRRPAHHDRRAPAVVGGAGATFRASRSSRAPTGAAPRAGSRSTSRSIATATSSAASASSSSDGPRRQGPAEENEARHQRDGRDRERRQGGGVLAHRPALLAHHAVHGRDALRRERRRPFGNTHIALGKSYQDCYAGDPARVAREEWERLGFNESSVHTDIVSTTDRVVTATLRGGGELVIYADGEFRL